MDDMHTQTALVTGTTSGLGFETAAQLADRDYSRIIVTGRHEARVADAASRLTSRTGKDVFETLVLDLDDMASVETAATDLAKRGGTIDTLILNAGIAPPPNVIMTASGLDATVTSSLIGHHLLTMRVLEAGLLAEGASIVIAGSEAARGDVPTFTPVDLHAVANDHFGGDLEKAIENQMRMEAPAKYKAGDTYATAKLFVAWWAAELSRLLPDGVSVNAVSPGSTPGTDAIRNAPFYMRAFMVPLFKLIPGMSHSVADGAGRYLEVADYDRDVTGKFFASKPKKMTGQIEEMRMDHFADQDAQRALWNVTSRVAGGVSYPVI
ncbi:MAG: SDR family NAD(P)-dependent oxidoreductase [Acidimicrobiia bacterium]|nr:SDR family NAD(P)-dependent oxidoreductase [Acidimicrobiia bacterium]MDX2467905.1 SDR family NAD(P)-dependent oxidoreductase [Acidimicrobiia bacterium]